MLDSQLRKLPRANKQTSDLISLRFVPSFKLLEVELNMLTVLEVEPNMLTVMEVEFYSK